MERRLVTLDHFADARHGMNMSDRALAILNFKLRPKSWRGLVNELSVEHGCTQSKNRYHEVHIYVRAGQAERSRLLLLAERYRLWSDRFRFTHERLNGQLIAIENEDAREELMIGTHWFAPVELAKAMASELLVVADQLGIDVERIRVERPMGRSPARVAEMSDIGWWEAHLSVEHDHNLSDVLRCEGIRDISRKVDFVTGDSLRQGYVNIEARDQTARKFAATCASVVQSLDQRSGKKTTASLEEVLIDLPLAMPNRLRRNSLAGGTKR
jgi:hypothetical protein